MAQKSLKHVLFKHAKNTFSSRWFNWSLIGFVAAEGLFQSLNKNE